VEILGSLAAGATAKSPAEPPSFKESIEKAKKVEEELKEGKRSVHDPVRDAVGNKEVVNITAGKQTINFDLKKPAE
jgi:hypothetical protein